ncbi:transmembrane sensor [Novosphingobium sp. SG751A]|uniref:FecR family protein n=1 Tax=Novosphingobium sp. SG751A TaxID=2587000 RepID=UPI00353007C8|nr:transmembrane sensor [Novosphingobium sp. SG751A]
MSNSNKAQDRAAQRKALEAEAARRFLKAQAGNGAQDWDEAMAWVALRPEHGVAFAKVEAGWEFAEGLRSKPPPWIGERADRRIALSLIAATIIGMIWTITLQLHGSVDRYHTALGEDRSVRLADGSLIHLNTATSVEVALREDGRHLHLLRGEARFDVAHDARRPFLVTIGSATVRAVGTAFNLRLRSDKTELTVIEGTVAVRDNGSLPRRVAAGNGAAIRGGTVAVTALRPASIQQRMAWERGRIELEGETLAQAVEDMNRYRAHPLILGDTKLAALRVGGSFHIRQSDDFVRALSASFGIRSIKGRDAAIILMPPENDE